MNFEMSQDTPANTIVIGKGTHLKLAHHTDLMWWVPSRCTKWISFSTPRSILQIYLLVVIREVILLPMV